jgi:hypothetical protein
MKKLALLAFLALLPGTASAQTASPFTAHALQKMCDSRYDIDVGICAGYITAIAEMVQQESSPGRRVCLSPAISPQTLMDHVQKYWAANPPAAQDLASFNVDLALRDRFKCP